jgi:N-acetylmuramoyl-L-alanine amidase
MSRHVRSRRACEADGACKDAKVLAPELARIGRGAVKALTLMIMVCIVQAAHAQLPPQQQSVLSVVEDAAGQFLLFNTSQLSPLSAPNVQYLPGREGETIMVLDFQGLAWNQPSKYIFPNVPGVKHVRIGQFQQAPPVCRIAITTMQPKVLKQLALVASPGSLVLKWPPVKKPEAPVKVAQAPVEVAVAPPVAPPIKKHWWKKPAPEPAPEKNIEPSKSATPVPAPARPMAPVVPAPPVAPPVVSQPAVVPQVCPPTISISGKEQIKVEFSGLNASNRKSFRLHDPERYVIDIPEHPEIANAAVPPTEENPALKSVRLGNPEGEMSTSRIVFDLSGPDVIVRESTENPSQLAFIIERIPGWQPSLPTITEEGKIPSGTAIVIDAGHGGSDPGAQRGDIQEKELTLAIAEKVRKKLAASGARVMMTRSDDSFVSLEDRVAITNNLKPDLFLSVHINSLEANSSIYGVETYYQTEQSKTLAQAIHEALVGKLAVPDRNVRKARFYVINHTPVPAVLAEVGFISNKEERNKLISSDYQEQVADGLARGVMLYLARRGELLQSGNTAKGTGTMNLSAQSEKIGGQARPAGSRAALSASRTKGGSSVSSSERVE